MCYEQLRFYATDLVLRRPETSATDKSHFYSFDTNSIAKNKKGYDISAVAFYLF